MGRGIIESREKSFFFFFCRKGKHGNCISIKPKGWKEWKQTQKQEKEEGKKVTQKLIILHYDYVVHSLTMRFSNWCQRSQSTQREGEKSSRKSCGWKVHFNDFLFSFVVVDFILNSKHVKSYKINLFTLQNLSLLLLLLISFSIRLFWRKEEMRIKIPFTVELMEWDFLLWQKLWLHLGMKGK